MNTICRTWLLRLCAWSLIAGVPTDLVAQTLGSTDSLLTRLTAEALAANPGLQGSRATARAAADRIRPAGALPDPMVTAGMMNLTLPGFSFHRSDFTEVDLELSQELPWPGTLGARTRAAQAEAQVRQADVATERREVVVRTAETYYRLRYVVTARATLQGQRTLLATAVEIATTRYATASAPQSDALQARVAVARLDAEDADLAAQEVALRADLTSMRNVRGRDSLMVDLIRPETVVTVGHGLLSTDDSIPMHPRLTARKAAVEAAEQTIRLEQLGARPDFTVMTRYGARPLGADFFSASLGLRLPVWAGRKQNRLADAARSDADAARAAEAAEAASLMAELRSVRGQVISGQRRLDLLTNQVVPSARATVDAALRTYRVGQGEFLTVLAAEDSLYRAQLDAAMIAAEHLTHLIILQQLLLPEQEQ